MKVNSLLRGTVAFFSAVFLAFGMCNVHAAAGITEGGILGGVLLLEHWIGISPAVTSLLLNILCYMLGWRTLGKPFLRYSFIAAFGYSIGYRFFELLPPAFPQIATHPFMAAFVGSVFVGIGCGLCVRCGAAPCGDDALAMSLSQICKIPIQWVYLGSDLVVLVLSLTYIPWNRMIYSLLTVILSGQIIGWVQKNPKS